MEDATTIAVDLSKDVFEIGVEKKGRICERKRLRKGQMAVYFCTQPAAPEGRDGGRVAVGCRAC